MGSEKDTVEKGNNDGAAGGDGSAIVKAKKEVLKLIKDIQNSLKTDLPEYKEDLLTLENIKTKLLLTEDARILEKFIEELATMYETLAAETLVEEASK